MNKQGAIFVLPNHFAEVLRRLKKVSWVSHFTLDCGANETVPPYLKLTIFTLQIEWDTSLNVCVIYPNSMIYFPVQCNALYSVLSGVVFSFSTKCLKVSDNAPRYASC